MRVPAVPPQDSAPTLLVGAIVCALAVVLHWVGLGASDIVKVIVLVLAIRSIPGQPPSRCSRQRAGRSACLDEGIISDMPPYQWITFLTDYGWADNFVGMCHGVMARIAPSVRIIDVTHLVPGGDIRHGAHVLEQAVPYLPTAVHVAVVDPGVGTLRRAVAVVAGEHVLVGPDNGLLLWAAQRLGGPERAYQLNAQWFQLRPISTTFHGRDVFSPAAAHIAAGVELEKLGTAIDVGTLTRLPAPVSRVVGDEVEGEVVIVDRFGNAQTSVKIWQLKEISVTVDSRIECRTAAGANELSFVETFASVDEGELLAYVDSAGLVALAVNRGDAAAMLGLEPGDRLTFRRVGS
jgi:S-adenosyl-L-methionine hydrolase (adenosine-forming)